MAQLNSVTLCATYQFEMHSTFWSFANKEMKLARMLYSCIWYLKILNNCYFAAGGFEAKR